MMLDLSNPDSVKAAVAALSSEDTRSNPLPRLLELMRELESWVLENSPDPEKIRVLRRLSQLLHQKGEALPAGSQEMSNLLSMVSSETMVAVMAILVQSNPTAAEDLAHACEIRASDDWGASHVHERLTLIGRSVLLLRVFSRENRIWTLKAIANQ